MGGTASHSPEGSKSTSQSENLVVSSSQGSQNRDNDIRKWRKDTPSHPNTSQTAYAHGHQQYASQYQILQARPNSFNSTQAMGPTNPQYQYQYQIPFQGACIARNFQPVMALGNQFYYQGYVGRQQQHGSLYIIQHNQFPLHKPAYHGVQQPTQWAPRASVSGENYPVSQQRPRGGHGRSDGSGGFKFHDC